ncbi:hypothetical protein DICSQDRAFT_168508 [Dichomitus squalens LYAD-421 SS1]|uniref:uncharacterized protein n=1 Tax=Dichomitus squalens (strain LYAD-421) TaxID=732165 RepID=UPI0004414B9D|nr:uncharacterized protein DICSQDRAFT_168508 [Dichomitus squalens LYAD-421 SS1]EJF62836.1 hypothetical protein DICSQDRAFT_168508 [Dichomitus squalens LYAD-421 SS1]
MSSFRDSPALGLPSMNSWMATENAPLFIWDDDSESFVSLSLDSPEGNKSWRSGGPADASVSPPPGSDWADEVEQELFADGKSVALFKAPTKTGAEQDSGASTKGKTESPEQIRAEIDALATPIQRYCDTVVEEESDFEDEDDPKNRLELPKSPSNRNDGEPRLKTPVVTDPLVDTGFGVQDLGYPLYAHTCPTVALLETVARGDDVAGQPLVDTEGLDGGFVVVDIAGTCVTPEGVEVGKHKDLLKRWTRAMKRGFSSSSISFNTKGPSKYQLSNSNYAKHDAQFHSVVHVTVIHSVERVAR